jgi:hypothetical protein
MISSDFLTYTLDNGIRLIHQQTNSPVAHLGVLIKVRAMKPKKNTDWLILSSIRFLKEPGNAGLFTY